MAVPLKISAWAAAVVQARWSSIPAESRPLTWKNAAAADAVHMSAEAMRLHIRMEKRLSITTNVRAADAVSEPAALMQSTMKTAVQTSFWTGRWQNMRWLSVRTVPASIFHWCRISAPTATVMAKMMRRSCRISVCLQALTR